jgi:hypothetical protein
VVRNVVVGASPLSLTANGSINLAVHNAAGANPLFFEAKAESFVPVLERGNARMLGTLWACLASFDGPIALGRFYLLKLLGLAVPFENPDNANFYYGALRSPILRLLPSWSLLLPLSLLGVGLALRRRVTALELLPALLSMLIVILVTAPLSRHRAVLAAFLAPFAGLAVVSVGRWLEQRRFGSVAAVALASIGLVVGGSAVRARVVFEGQPAGTRLYRHHEFTLAAVSYAGQRRYAAAAREMLDLARLNQAPEIQSAAFLTAARYQIARGDGGDAARALEDAAAAGGSDPQLLGAIGDAYARGLGEPARAAAYYRRALRLSPDEPLRSDLIRRLSGLGGPPDIE